MKDWIVKSIAITDASQLVKSRQ